MYTSQHTGHTHLRQEDRVVIEALHADGVTLRTIARTLGIHYSTISRELTRNRRGDGAYTAHYAQKKYTMRRVQAKQCARKIENDAVLGSTIETLLQGTHVRGDWSPAIIAHTLKRVGHQTIYTWIYRTRQDLRRVLPRSGRYRRQYGSYKAPSRGWTTKIRSIDTRPQEIQTRTTVGHYEGDTVLLNRTFALLTLVERTSRFLITELITAQVGMAYAVHIAMVSRLSPLPPSLRQTVTPDRGGEFAYWDMTEKDIPGLSIYFAHPHSPWERGTNEHANGLLRRYFPKKEKHDTVTSAQVAEVAWMINHRPRKSLNWETPCRVFGACCTSG